MRPPVCRLIERAGLLALLTVTGCATILGIDQGTLSGSGPDGSTVDASNDLSSSGGDDGSGPPDGRASHPAAMA